MGGALGFGVYGLRPVVQGVSNLNSRLSELQVLLTPLLKPYKNLARPCQSSKESKKVAVPETLKGTLFVRKLKP